MDFSVFRQLSVKNYPMSMSAIKRSLQKGIIITLLDIIHIHYTVWCETYGVKSDSFKIQLELE